jgi:hypothetical protein
MEVPKWKRGDLGDRLQDPGWTAESVFERQVGDVVQVVERIMLRSRPTQDVRPFYRLVEVREGRPRKVRTAELAAAYTQREVRAAADRRAKKILRKMEEVA